MISEIIKEKRKIPKPILSEEQIQELEQIILELYNAYTEAIFLYYRNGELREITGTITKLDSISKKISLDNGKTLYFSNIIKISAQNT